MRFAPLLECLSFPRAAGATCGACYVAGLRASPPARPASTEQTTSRLFSTVALRLVGRCRWEDRRQVRRASWPRAGRGVGRWHHLIHRHSNVCLGKPITPLPTNRRQAQGRSTLTLIIPNENESQRTRKKKEKREQPGMSGNRMWRVSTWRLLARLLHLRRMPLIGRVSLKIARVQ